MMRFNKSSMPRSNRIHDFTSNHINRKGKVRRLGIYAGDAYVFLTWRTYSSTTPRLFLLKPVNGFCRRLREV